MDKNAVIKKTKNTTTAMNKRGSSGVGKIGWLIFLFLLVGFILSFSIPQYVRRVVQIRPDNTVWDPLVDKVVHLATSGGEGSWREVWYHNDDYRLLDDTDDTQEILARVFLSLGAILGAIAIGFYAQLSSTLQKVGYFISVVCIFFGVLGYNLIQRNNYRRSVQMVGYENVNNSNNLNDRRPDLIYIRDPLNVAEEGHEHLIPSSDTVEYTEGKWITAWFNSADGFYTTDLDDDIWFSVYAVNMTIGILLFVAITNIYLQQNRHNSNSFLKKHINKQEN